MTDIQEVKLLIMLSNGKQLSSEIECIIFQYDELVIEYVYSISSHVFKKHYTLYQATAHEYLLSYLLHDKKHPWLACEEFVMRKVESAYVYAIFVLKERWAAAEDILIQNPAIWDMYSNKFLKATANKKYK